MSHEPHPTGRRLTRCRRGRTPAGLAALAALLVAVAGACASSGGSGAEGDEPAGADCGSVVEADPADFVDPTRSTNPFHPTTPGLQWVRGGTTLVGQREESDYVADFLREGSSQMPFAELSLRWKLAPWLRPVVSVYGEALVPHDDSAKAGVLVRGLFGAGFTGAAGTLTPFVAAAAGNGKGWLVNRQELSLSLGVRLSLESAP